MASQAIKQFQYPKFAGKADSLFSGIAGSFYKIQGLTYNEVPGLLQVQQKLTLVSASTITALCRVSLSLSNGYKLWFSYTDGKIWAQDTSDVFTLVYTTSPAAGTAGCLGAKEFNGYIYWATQSRLHRTLITDVPAFGSVTPNFGTFTATDSEFHPMEVVTSSNLFIGDGHLIASVDSSASFTASFFDILTPNRIKCMSQENTDLVIGTITAQSVNTAKTIRVNTFVSPVIATYIDEIQENGVNCFMKIGVHLYAQAGTSGNWYVYNGQKLLPAFKIPGTWTPTQFGEVYPNAQGNFRGIPVFGFSNSPAAGNSTGNPADQGIYTYGSYSKNYPVTLNGVEYPISADVVSGIEIGSIVVEGNNMYVSWKNGSSYGVDKVDWSNKYANAYFETMAINLYSLFRFRINMPPPQTIQGLAQAFVDYASLPAGTAVTFSYKVNNETNYHTFGTGGVVDDKTDGARQVYAEDSPVGRLFQIKVAFTVSGNSTPQIESYGFSAA